MKNILITLLLITSTLLFVSCNTNTKADNNSTNTNVQKSNQLSYNNSTVKEGLPTTSISWNKMSHDFGKITAGDVVTTTFTITNTGENPLIINDAKGSCGCTVPKVEKGKPIAPGESTEIEVRFDSTNRSGAQTKNVDIYANIDNNPSSVKIKAEVEPKTEG